MVRCCCTDTIGNLDLPAMNKFRAEMLRTKILAVFCSICRKIKNIVPEANADVARLVRKEATTPFGNLTRIFSIG
jgi:hypothetical protein